jgi:hypothetical protein
MRLAAPPGIRTTWTWGKTSCALRRTLPPPSVKPHPTTVAGRSGREAVAIDRNVRAGGWQPWAIPVGCQSKARLPVRWA